MYYSWLCIILEISLLVSSICIILTFLNTCQLCYDLYTCKSTKLQVNCMKSWWIQLHVWVGMVAWEISLDLWFWLISSLKSMNEVLALGRVILVSDFNVFIDYTLGIDLIATTVVFMAIWWTFLKRKKKSLVCLGKSMLLENRAHPSNLSEIEVWNAILLQLRYM